MKTFNHESKFCICIFTQPALNGHGWEAYFIASVKRESEFVSVCMFLVKLAAGYVFSKKILLEAMRIG